MDGCALVDVSEKSLITSLRSLTDLVQGTLWSDETYRTEDHLGRSVPVGRAIQSNIQRRLATNRLTSITESITISVFLIGVGRD
jgi:hypothetical protein